MCKIYIFPTKNAPKAPVDTFTASEVKKLKSLTLKLFKAPSADKAEIQSKINKLLAGRKMPPMAV